ncbi:FMN-binding glutamate synthase family protein [Nitrogeniibacter mangrovi]|uniref:FMN-binding glutamate synthase family protein n=1 Tax=Nitrogeniibacter mangrovi TaxID=2016596 RepID=A0A6C1B6Y7_9RHOO|nr:FMN-binding glutamate synthase family protein [Nitrogeniibacter mangrovi]QID19123.1 FMN-binding glutamate synthase family protein [Nitrogeniibacter mangrovi]
MKTLSRYAVLLLVIVLSALGIVLAPRHAWAYWLLAVTLPLLLVGLRDLAQRGWTITRNYPITGHLRTFFYWLRPYLRSYIVEDDLTGTPYSYDARNLVHARARGRTDTQPFGTERNTDDHDHHWITHSIVPHPAPDTSPRVQVGNAQTRRPYSASVLNISAMSFGALSAHAIEALNLGAKRGGFYHDTGEGGISPYHLKHGGDLVWELGSGYFGARDRHGRFDPQLFHENASRDAVKMTEIKLSQGAKPGHGGLLPAAKVTEEIAAVRHVPAHQDCLSPRGHSAFSTPIEMLEFAARMRELSGGKPVGLKLCVGKPHEVFAIMKAILKTGITPEFIVVDGAEGGTGAAPAELSDWVGMPLMDALILMRNALVGAGLKGDIRLAASGKIHSGMGLARNLALGADWCNAARAFMFSVGCVQSQRCHLGTCPTGVATQDPLRQRALVPEVQGPRAARFHEKTVESLSEIVAAAGFAHPSDLQPYHLIHRIGPEKSAPVDQIHPFLPEDILLEAPDDTVYADWWRVAQAESFAPAEPLRNYRFGAGPGGSGPRGPTDFAGGTRP